MEAYLDNSATTQPCKEAVDKMNYTLKTCWGNPSSLHAKGIAASELIEDSRRNVAKALSCESSEIYFTSGGTESNNIAVFIKTKFKLGISNDDSFCSCIICTFFV